MRISGNSKIYFAPISGATIGKPIELKQKRSAKGLSYGKVKFRVEWNK